MDTLAHIHMYAHIRCKRMCIYTCTYIRVHANIRAMQVSVMQDKYSEGYKEAVGSVKRRTESTETDTDSNNANLPVHDLD